MEVELAIQQYSSKVIWLKMLEAQDAILVDTYYLLKELCKKN